jgi:hypothetical protein
MLGRQSWGGLVFQRENRMRYVNTVQISDRQGGNTPEAPRPPCAPTQLTGQIQIASSRRRNAASRSKMPQTGPVPPRPLALPAPPGAASATPSDSGSSPRLSPVTPRARSVLSFQFPVLSLPRELAYRWSRVTQQPPVYLPKPLVLLHLACSAAASQPRPLILVQQSRDAVFRSSAALSLSLFSSSIMYPTYCDILGLSRKYTIAVRIL